MFFHSIQIERNLQESKLAAEEKATEIKSADDGAADLKKSFQELSKSLDEHQKEFQVNYWIFSGLISIHTIHIISFLRSCIAIGCNGR